MSASYESEVLALAQMFLLGTQNADIPPGLPRGNALSLLNLWRQELIRIEAVGPAFYFLLIDEGFRKRVASARLALWGSTGRFHYRPETVPARLSPHTSERHGPEGLTLSVRIPPVDLTLFGELDSGVATDWLVWGDFESPWTLLPAVALGLADLEVRFHQEDAQNLPSFELRVYSASFTPRTLARVYGGLVKRLNAPGWGSARAADGQGFKLLQSCELDDVATRHPAIVMRFSPPLPSMALVESMYRRVLEATGWRDRLYDAPIVRKRGPGRQLAGLVRAWALLCLENRFASRQRAMKFWNKNMPREFRAHLTDEDGFTTPKGTQISREVQRVRRIASIMDRKRTSS